MASQRYCYSPLGLTELALASCVAPTSGFSLTISDVDRYNGHTAFRVG